ncbi:hypothetical protein QP162_20550 [Sphingomonas aurantiaca]|uniref:hypothetical protein n=1 Tax=Sphingomonas aurantiaca TaxID=185949 RepID=UPI002FE2A842
MAGWLSRMSKACPKVAAPCACAGFLTPGFSAGLCLYSKRGGIAVDDLKQKMRELLGGLGEYRQPGSAPCELENLLCLRMTEIALNRPTGMSCPKDVYAEWMAEEAEQFVSLARTLMLEIRDGFSSHQRLLFGGIIYDLNQNIERFINDTLLIMGDRQEIRRRLEAS